ncbi:MAG: hypothetical protein J3R72DRAFT_530161 [Linnemannia gamsii]|nr:MAG: hypothetical protein J3R72DRAFT_530161 [Linnemannia gamsii]
MTNNLPNVQAFRPIPKSSVDTPVSSSSGQEPSPVGYVDIHEFVLWEDIQLAFEGVLHVRHLARVVPFLKRLDFRTLEPRMIAEVPKVVLDALLETPPQETAPPLPQKASLEPETPTQESSFKVKVVAEIAGIPSSFSEGAMATMRCNPHGDNNDNNRPTELSSATTSSRRSPQAPQNLSSATAAMGNSKTIIDANHRDRNAQVALGDRFALGLEVDQDYAEAIDWYLRVDNAGDASAQNKVRDLYRLGHGVPQDCSVAMDWYRKAADQGDAAGPYHVGQMYDNALGVPGDYSTTMAWCLKASAKKYAPAQTSIGDLHANGQGVPEGNSRALEWYFKASSQEFLAAEFNIAGMFEEGRGVPKDESAALEWFNKAIRHGESDS